MGEKFLITLSRMKCDTQKKNKESEYFQKKNA